LEKKDAQLSLSSIFTIGDSDRPGGVINRNMKLVSHDADGNYTVSDEVNRTSGRRTGQTVPKLIIQAMYSKEK
jgi:hypothetical protein